MDSNYERQLNVEVHQFKVIGIEVKPSLLKAVLISGETVWMWCKNQGSYPKTTLPRTYFQPTFTYVELYHTSLLDEITLYQGANLKVDALIVRPVFL